MVNENGQPHDSPAGYVRLVGTCLHGEWNRGNQSPSQIGPLEAGDPSQFGRLFHQRLRLGQMLFHNEVFVIDIVSLNITDQPAHSLFRLDLAVHLAKPDCRKGA